MWFPLWYFSFSISWTLQRLNLIISLLSTTRGRWSFDQKIIFLNTEISSSQFSLTCKMSAWSFLLPPNSVLLIQTKNMLPQQQKQLGDLFTFASLENQGNKQFHQWFNLPTILSSQHCNKLFRFIYKNLGGIYILQSLYHAFKMIFKLLRVRPSLLFLYYFSVTTWGST